MRARLLIWLAIAVILPLPPQVQALALSDVELQSHLNQPLSARIRLLDVPDGDPGTLSIRVAEVTDEVGTGRRTALRHRVVAEGQDFYLLITSRDAVREPILSFVVELDWAAGHLLRTYALIIDPQ